MPKKKKPYTDFLKRYYELTNNSIESEIWKPINIGDYPLYEISNHGRVRRIGTDYIINPFHTYRKSKDGKFRYDRPTYLRVQLYYYENGIRKKKHFEISRLVAIEFIPIPEKYKNLGYTYSDLEVNHIKGGYEIYNNFASNLEWCTTKENVIKSIETNLRHPPKGSTHHKTFLDENDVIEICKCIERKIPVNLAYYLVESIKEKEIPYDQFRYTYFNIKYHNSWNFISQYFDF